VLAGGEEYFQTQVALLQSRALAARVVTDMGLEQNPSFTVPPQPLDQLRYWLMGSIESILPHIIDF
jgi:uncharacterized protein involved in exopolysaccharide biosynthesis